MQPKYKKKLDEFIAAYEPGGLKGIDTEHASGYSREAPYFELAGKYMPTNMKSWKIWFTSYEHTNYLGATSTTSDGAAAKMEEHIAGAFLSFAKSLFNVLSSYKACRTPPKILITTLIVLEKSLRIQFGESNDPSKMDHQTFSIATSLTQSSNYAANLQYEIGRGLELISGMTQDGYHTKGFRRADQGFNLLAASFDFRSPIKNVPRLNDILAREKKKVGDTHKNRLSLDHLRCLGTAYQKSHAESGMSEATRFAASLTTVGFVAASMRSAEVTFLSRDAIYRDNEEVLRLRIFRSKTDLHQDLPIPKILSELAQESFDHVLAISEAAHEAFKWYIARFKTLKSVNELFIPPELTGIFQQPFLDVDMLRVLGMQVAQANKSQKLLTIFAGLEPLKFVWKAGDLSSFCSNYDGLPTVVISDALLASEIAGFRTRVPPEADSSKYITRSGFEQFLGEMTKSKRSFLREIFSGGPKIRTFFRTSEVKACLLADFKNSVFPHWSFVEKQNALRLDQALAVSFAASNNPFNAPGQQPLLWWRPDFFNSVKHSRWINSANPKRPPMLFQALGIRLSTGQYPNISLEDARKYHQTQGLLAGISPLFLDAAAGRSSGRQSDHYDWRSKQEKIQTTVEALNLGTSFATVGPVAATIRNIPVVHRDSYMFEAAYPKHMTLNGGCRSDWSINPCEQLGDCLRCGGQVWIRGDRERLPKIQEIKKMSEMTIEKGKSKLISNPKRDTIRAQIVQAQEALDRCNEIIATEEDESIVDGTVVTFAKAKTSMGISDRQAYIRNSREAHGSAQT